MRTVSFVRVPALVWGALAACALGSGCSAPKPTQPAPPGAVAIDNPNTRRFALLVGVSNYDEPASELSNLAYPEDDVNGLAAALHSGGYAAENVVVMTVAAGRGSAKLSPTATNIRARLKEMLALTKADDVVLVAFTGHGVETQPGHPHFCPYRCQLNNPDTLLDLTAIQEEMAASAAGTKVLLSDACRVAGTKAPKPRPLAEATPPTVTAKSDTTFITYFSCKTGEYSWESDELKHGLFFAHLINGLSGKADAQNDGHVTWAELTEYVQQRMGDYNEKNPNRKQTPHFRGEVLRTAALAVRAPTAGGASGAAVVGEGVVRTIPVNAAVPSGDPRLEIVLLRVEHRNDRRMRWHFTFWNKTGKKLEYELYPTSGRYVTDDQGRRSDPLAASPGTDFGLRLPDGEKVNYWMDFQESLPGAKVLTARFTGNPTLPTLTVRLDGTGAGTPGAPQSGTVVLTTSKGIRADAEVWVEVNGAKVAVWETGKTEVEFTVPAGRQRIAVYSKFQGRTSVVYDQAGDVPADKRTAIRVGP